jgi:predicted nucleotidyltransferase
MKDKRMTLNEISFIVKPIADRYKIQAVYLFGSYARNEATAESDLDFLVYGGEHFKLTRIFAFGEELRKALNKEVDVFEISEVNEDSDFYQNIMKDRVLVA